jgi:hypothetical protein
MSDVVTSAARECLSNASLSGGRMVARFLALKRATKNVSGICSARVREVTPGKVSEKRSFARVYPRQLRTTLEARAVRDVGKVSQDAGQGLEPDTHQKMICKRWGKSEVSGMPGGGARVRRTHEGPDGDADEVAFDGVGPELLLHQTELSAIEGCGES